MTSGRQIVVIALAGVLFATPLSAVVKCPNGTEICARVSECPLRDPTCQRAADSQKPGTDAACQVCGYTILPFAGKMSADYPTGLQTVGVTMVVNAGVSTTDLGDALVEIWPHTPRHLLHCALLI